eukprot:5655210-Alexandrium_andersonii.AAC.1
MDQFGPPGLAAADAALLGSRTCRRPLSADALPGCDRLTDRTSSSLPCGPTARLPIGPGQAKL